MIVEPLAIPDVKRVRLVRHGDPRGWFCETFSAAAFAAAGLPTAWAQDNEAFSTRVHTVRGLHFQRPPHGQAKLVRVAAGRILDIAVDLRAGSSTFGRHVALEMDADDPVALFVPEGFAHGYCTLSDQARVTYKVTRPWRPGSEGALSWADPALDIAWPVAPEDAIVSDKDQSAPRLAETAPLLA